MGAGAASQEATEAGPSTSAILISLWAFASLFWSIFTEPHRTFAARVLLFQPLWIARIFFSDPTWIQDLGLFLPVHFVYSFWAGSWSLYTSDDLRKKFDLNDEGVRVNLQVLTLLGGCGLLASMIVRRGHQLGSEVPTGPSRQQSIEEALLPPLLITSRTDHSRLFPEKHAFSYSYLFAGIPVGLRGRVGNVLSVDSPRPAWFDVRSQDYLVRGQEPLSLGEKLKRYLHSEGVTDRDYSFAYLVTAPRFLGYSFNPVSFWYIYDSDTHLKYMILEVNNTFDERRMYLLKMDESKDAIEDVADGQSRPSKTLVFSDAWNKDFHVSPFNSRKGSYSLKAMDPLAALLETGHVKIDNTIVLRSSKERPKIVARVYSEGPPRDPKQVTMYQLAKFILAWWWVGLATFPRIVWEAQKLFFRRKLHVWYRPETTETSIGRTYSEDERSLEEFFRAFLTDSVENATNPLRVIYEPAHNESGEVVMYSPGFTYEEDHTRTLTIKILSPAFYSRFIHYAHAKEAFDRECLTTDEKNRTVALQGTESLPALLDALRDTAKRLHRKSQKTDFLDGMRWGLLRRLRCPPAAASYPSDESRLDSEYNVQDIRSFHFSELDRYVQHTSLESDVYRRIAIKLFMAERAALGLPGLVALSDWIIRSILLLVPMMFAESANAFDILRLRTFIRADLVKTAILLLLANSVHLWSFAKG